MKQPLDALRFHTGVPVGRGASGQVLKSWDTRLERPVALKLLRRDDPAAAAQMLREARAQASVAHSNICPIYDVGELDGRPYIAMQYIDGRPLDEAARELPIRDRVKLVATVADAVDAAHSVGLVHRDLKPANILVEATDGALTPYVLDFGIARERDAPGATRTGQIVGTPGYMAPEQARGEVHSLGRRSDVFSLGVVLYHLLTGRAPFAGGSAAEVLVRLLNEDYPTPRQASPEIPRDLATIVHKALEYDPERRYATAGELRDDLRAWLAGDPISARPATVGYRLAKRVRKHPRIAAAALVALVLTAAGALAMRSQARRQMVLADSFSDRVQKLTTRLDLAYRLPFHDVAPERRSIESELAALQAEIASSGRLARAPGDLALGRGYLALGHYRRARDHLQRAQKAGHETPEVALALGRALGELYLEESEDLTRIADPLLREEARERIERELGQPARRLLAEARDAELGLAGHELAWVSGLVEFYLGDPVEALTRAELAGRTEWFQEAQILAGTVHLDLAVRALLASNLSTAETALAAATDELSRVIAKAPSDPRGYGGLCRAALLGVRLRVEAGVAPDSAYEAAAVECDRAIAVDSSGFTALLDRAEAAQRMALAATRRGEDPGSYLETSMGDAERVLALAPAEPRALAHLAGAWSVRAERARDLGTTPFPAFDRAAGYLRRALEQAPADGHLRLELGHLLTRWGQYLGFAGEEPLPVLEEARALFEYASDSSEVLGAYRDLGLCNVEAEIGYHLFQRAESPGTSFEVAVDACRRAERLLPGHLQAKHNLGYALWSRAEWEAGTGRDPRESFNAAAEAFEQVLELDPDRATTRVNTAHLLEELAAWSLERGLPVAEILERAERFNRSIAEVYPPDFHLIQGKIERVRALDRLARGGDPSAAFDAAERHALRATELQPGQVNEMATLVEIYRRRADWHLASGRARAARRDAESGLAWLRRSLDVDADQPRLLDARTALEEVLGTGYIGAPVVCTASGNPSRIRDTFRKTPNHARPDSKTLAQRTGLCQSDPPAGSVANRDVRPLSN